MITFTTSTAPASRRKRCARPPDPSRSVVIVSVLLPAFVIAMLALLDLLA